MDQLVEERMFSKIWNKWQSIARLQRDHKYSGVMIQIVPGATFYGKIILRMALL